MTDKNDIFGHDIPSVRNGLLNSFLRYIQAGQGNMFQEDFLKHGFINKAYSLLSAMEKLIQDGNKIATYSLMRVFYENLIVFCYLHTNKNGVVILKDFSKHEKTFQEAMKNIERSYSDMDNHFQKFVARNKNIKATLFKDTYALYSHYVHFSHHNIYNNISRTEKTGGMEMSISENETTWTENDKKISIVDAVNIGNITILLLHLITEERKTHYITLHKASPISHAVSGKIKIT